MSLTLSSPASPCTAGGPCAPKCPCHAGGRNNDQLTPLTWLLHACKHSLTSHIFRAWWCTWQQCAQNLVTRIEPAQQLSKHGASIHSTADFTGGTACLNVLDGESLVDAFGRQVTLGVEGGHTTGTRGGHRLTVDVVCSIARNKYPLTVGFA